jgi:hypothetical protein
VHETHIVLDEHLQEEPTRVGRDVLAGASKTRGTMCEGIEPDESPPRPEAAGSRLWEGDHSRRVATPGLDKAEIHSRSGSDSSFLFRALPAFSAKAAF